MATKDKALKVDAGTMACPLCGENIPVRRSLDTNTLHYPCTWCGNPGYAQKGTKAHGIIGAKLTPVAGAVAEAVRPPAPTPTPAAAPVAKPPAVKTPASFWHGLGAS